MFSQGCILGCANPEGRLRIFSESSHPLRRGFGPRFEVAYAWPMARRPDPYWLERSDGLLLVRTLGIGTACGAQRTLFGGRKSLGEWLVILLKVRLNCDTDWNPTSRAMAPMRRLGFCSRLLAFSTRTRPRCSTKLIPVNSLKRLLK